MDVLSTTTKGWQAAKVAAQHPALTRFTIKIGAKSAPPLAKLSWKIGKPLAKRKASSKLEQFGEQLAEVGEAIFAIGEVFGAVMAEYGPLAAQQLGWAEVPKQKRTAPRVAAGVVIGAGAMYFLEPKGGPERRQQVLRLVGSAPAQTADGSAQAAGAPVQTASAAAPTAGAPAPAETASAPTASTPAEPT